MILDTLTRDQVLEAIIVMAAKDLPDDLEGDIAASYNDENGIDIHFEPVQSPDPKLWN